MARGDRLLVAVLLLPPGFWLGLRTLRPARARDPRPPSPRTTRTLALLVGIAGGIYGIGGRLAARARHRWPRSSGRHRRARGTGLHLRDLPRRRGHLRAALPDRYGPGRPDWLLSLSCGAGGLLGAHLQPRVPEVGLRLLLAALATGVGVAYTVQVLSRPGRPGPEPTHTRGKPRSLPKGGRVRLRFRWRRRMRRRRSRSRGR